MKILISHTSVYNKAGWGRVFPLAAGLAIRGNHVTILTTNPRFSLLSSKRMIQNVNVRIFPEILPARVSRTGFGLLSLFLKLIHILFNKYDVVHSDNGHRPLAGMPCRLSKKIHKSVYVAEWYDWYGKGGQYDTKSRLFKCLLGRYELKWEIKDKVIADGVVVLSELLRSRAETFKQKNRIVKIHGGSDVVTIPYLKENRKLKEQFNLNPEILTLGYINSSSYILEEFMPLLETLDKYKLDSNVKILLYGESQALQSELDKKYLRYFIFFGWVDFTIDYKKLQLTDVFFLFKQEILGNRAGWPNSIGDCFACGRPLLLNPVGEVIDFALKYPFAFIETTKAPDDIYAKLQYIFTNRDQIRENGVLIRTLAEEVVSWERKSKDLLEFYLYLMEEKLQD